MDGTLWRGRGLSLLHPNKETAMSARDRSVTEPASFAPQEDPDPAVVDIEEVEELEAHGSRQGIGRPHHSLG